MQKQPLNKDDEYLLKKYNTWIKGSVGTVCLWLIITAIYLGRVVIYQNSEFWFNVSNTEFFLKKGPVFAGYNGTWPLWLSIVLVVVGLAVIIVFTAMANKNPKHLILCLIYTLADTGLMVYMMATDYFGDMDDSTWINAICRVFVLVFIVVGIIGWKKRETLQSKQK